MDDCKIVFNFLHVEQKLEEEGYSVSAIENGFYIHNRKGTIVADCKNVDGLRGFLQGVEWSNEKFKNEKI